MLETHCCSFLLTVYIYKKTISPNPPTSYKVSSISIVHVLNLVEMICFLNIDLSLGAMRLSKQEAFIW